MKLSEFLFSLMLLNACTSSAPIKDKSFIPTPARLGEIVEEAGKKGVEENITSPENHNALSEDIYRELCPAGMSNIENKFCIDQYEASIVDWVTGEDASPHYIPSQEGLYDADWQFVFFEKLRIPSAKLIPLGLANQPI